MFDTKEEAFKELGIHSETDVLSIEKFNKADKLYDAFYRKLTKQNNKIFNQCAKSKFQLIDDDSIFIDELGNSLSRGNMICYISDNKMKVGVFLGMTERTVPVEIKFPKIRITQDYYKSYSYSSNKPKPFLVQQITCVKYEVGIERMVGYSTLNKKERVHNFFRPLQESTTDKGVYEVAGIIQVQRPEFRVEKPAIARCLSLMDDLKAGIFKNLNLDQEDV